MKKIPVLLSLALAANTLIIGTAFATSKNADATLDHTYTVVGQAKVVTEEEEKELAKDAAKKKVYGKSLVRPSAPSTDSITPDATVPGYGATDVVPYAYANGSIIMENEEDGTLSTIKDVAMTVGGIYVGTVGGIVLTIADIIGKQVAPEEYARAKTMKSYRYIGKEGRVYTSSGWKLWWETRSREVYKHYLASFSDPAGYTYTDSKDFTRVNGYNPVVINWSTHYNDHTYIQNTAYNNWKYNRYWVVESGY